ncbi:MAG: hypothetical protein J0G99_06210 [Alphaproteobacteria bacterium]|nr:hypothetical protein [Alphaproteobacteria bacterium]
MIRRIPVLCLALLTAACASKPLPPPVPAPHAIPPEPPRGEPSDFLGMTAAALRRQVGAPAFVRKDGGMEMWRYDGADCHAFFFLYDAQGSNRGQKAVRHVETLPHGAAGAADMDCLAALKLIPAKTS